MAVSLKIYTSPLKMIPLPYRCKETSITKKPPDWGVFKPASHYLHGYVDTLRSHHGSV